MCGRRGALSVRSRVTYVKGEGGRGCRGLKRVHVSDSETRKFKGASLGFRDKEVSRCITRIPRQDNSRGHVSYASH